ncbi:MAG: hypothetical protein ACK5PB_22760 [Pirellula sp.]|jgi:hypothetical protein
MRRAIAFVLAFLALFIGIWLLASRQREQFRRSGEERRDLWVFSVKSRLEKGEREVALYSCANTDFLLSSIRGMPEVESILFLETIDLSDRGIDVLPTFPNLKRLVFAGERGLNDSNLKILQQCQSLEVLEINRTQVTEPGIGAIKKIRTLKSIVLSSEFGNEAVEELRASRPDLLIERRDTR